MADIFDQVGAAPPSKGDIFDQVGAAPPKLSETLPHPQLVDQAVTANARAMVGGGDAMHAGMSAQPEQPLWQKLLMGVTAPGMLLAPAVREGAAGRALGISSETAESRREDPSNPLFRFEALTPHPGAMRGAAEFASGLTTPQNLLLMAGTSGLGALEGQLGKGLVSRLVSAGFSADMLHNAYRQIPSLRDAWNQGDWPQVRQQLVKLTLGTGMAALGARHALKGEPGAAAEKPAAAPAEQEYTITGQPVRPAGGDIFDQVAKEKSNEIPNGSAARPQDEPQGGAAAERQPVGGPERSGAGERPAGREASGTAAGEVNHEYFRGDWNIPMNEDGRRQVAEQAQKTAGQFDRIYSGTKGRHVETAQAYAAANPQAGAVESSAAFDPMHLGMHEGEEVTPERLADVNDRFRNRPDEPIPGVGQFSGSPGEAPAAWSKRLIGGVEDVARGWKPGEKHLIVTSGRDIQAVRAWVAKGMPEDRSVDPDVLTSAWKTQPGEMMRLDPQTGKVENVSAADQDGIYFARHGETDGNDNGAVPAEVAGNGTTGEPARVQVAGLQGGGSPGEQVNVQGVAETPHDVDDKTTEPAAALPPDPEGESALKQFLGEETGTSLVGAAFRESKAEGDALRAKRNDALAAVKAAEASREERKAGEKLRSWFTSEVDLWSARTNQVTDIVSRKILPQIAKREAVAIMREFRHQPEELQRFIDGTHADLENVKGGVSNAMMRLDRVQPLMREALRMIAHGKHPREEAADQAYTKLAAASLEEGKRGGWLQSRWQNDQYVPHYLHPKGEGEVAREPSTAGRAMGGQIGKFFGFGERRADQYPTLLHAIADGLVPKTLDPSALFTIHGAQFARARATHLLEGQLSDSGMGKWGSGDRAPRGWVPLAGHTDEFLHLVPFMRQAGKVEEARTAAVEVAASKLAALRAGKSYQELSGTTSQDLTTVPDVAQQRLYVPPFIDKALSPITTPDWLAKEIPGFAKLRTFQRGLKQAILGLSGFHLLTENVMAKVDIGPSAMYRALKIAREDPQTLFNERDGIASGLTTSISGKTVDAYKSLSPGTIPTRGEVIRAYIPGSKQALQAADAVTEYTFANVARRYKVWGYALHRDAWMNDNPLATPEQLAAAKQGIASYTNGVYGGLHWENMGLSRAMVEVGRALFLAPDWSGSNIALAKYAGDLRNAPLSLQEFTRHPLQGALTKEAVQGRLARRFWFKQAVQGLTENQMLSLLLSGQLSPRPFQVYQGKDKQGRDVYQNVFFRGSAGDLISLASKMEDHGLLVGAGVFMGSKAAPVAKLGLHVATGRDDFGREITPRGMNPVAATVRSAGTLVTDVSPVPLTLRNLGKQAFADDSDKYLWSERILSLLGSPAQHVAPDGMRMTKHGLAPKGEKPRQSIFKEIETGKR